MRKPFFHRHKTYVAVKPMVLNDKELAMGDVVPGLRRFRMRSLYRRNLIGPEGEPWTEARMQRNSNKYGLEMPSTKDDLDDDFESRDETTEDNDESTDETTEDDDESANESTEEDKE